MPTIGSLEIEIKANNSKLRANLAEASSLIRDWSLLVTGLTAGVTNAFRTIASIGVKAITVSMATLGGAFAITAKIGSDFEDSMVRTFTILKESSNVTGDAFLTLTAKALQLGRDTLFSATDAAQGMGILARAGFRTTEILQSIGPALNLAIVGELELAAAAQFTTEALRGFNLQTFEAGRVVDVMALGASKANTSVQELAEALSFVAPAAAGVGLSLEETVAALGLLSDAGIKGSRAGTSLRRAITELIAPTGESEKIFNKLGLSFIDSSGKLKSFTRVLAELKNSGITTAEVMRAFGDRAGPGMVALITRGSSALNTFRGDLNNARGSAERMAQSFRTTVIGRTKDLIASLVNLGITFFQEFQRPLADTIFAIRNYVIALTETARRTGFFANIIKGIRNASEPAVIAIQKLSKQFLDFIKKLTPKNIADFFANIRTRVEEFVTSISSNQGLINQTFKKLKEDLGSIKDSLLPIGNLAGLLFSKLSDESKASALSIGLISAAFVTLFGGLINVIGLLIVLGVLVKFIAGRFLIFGALGKVVSSAWAGVVIIFKGILLPTILAIIALLSTMTMIGIIAETETWGALLDVIRAKWTSIASGINVAVKQAALFFDPKNAKKADELFAAREERALAEREAAESQARLTAASVRDVKRQNQLLGRPQEEVPRILKSISKDIISNLAEIGLPIFKTKTTTGDKKTDRFQTLMADLGPDFGKLDLSGTLEEVNKKFLDFDLARTQEGQTMTSLFGNLLTIVERGTDQAVITKVAMDDILNNRLPQIESKLAELSRQGTKVVKDSVNRSPSGSGAK